MMRLMIHMFWPSFLVAILAEGLFFSVFDPDTLPLPHLDFELSHQAIYTVGFLFFWACCALSSLVTCYLQWIPSDLLSDMERKSGSGL